MITEEDIFEAASALPAQNRPEYLDGVCAGQPELRARLEALLRSHDVAGFMEVSGPDALFGQSGERIGRYRLIKQIGEGGFAVVWLAEEVEPAPRQVALKIIKEGMDAKEVLARFEGERQAIATMAHPNIAKVHEAGMTNKGRPYFVMEFVEGVPITQFCDRKEFTTRQRLQIFAELCSAITHAHQKGVLHRDIKPSNVLVSSHGDQPVAKVVDYGIARATGAGATDKAPLHGFRQFPATPGHLSPEQTSHSGTDVDTRADIYSLGILLYELLTGKPPFEAMSLVAASDEEVERIIREVEPPRPSSRLNDITGEERNAVAKARHIRPEKLRHLIEPDLDWIVMKAIEKDRTRRYDSADGFARDIRRFLAGEPVSAARPATNDRLHLFARRHKKALILAALAIAALVAAAIISTNLMVGLLVAAVIVSLWQAVRATIVQKEATRTERLAQAKAAAESHAREDAESVSTFLIDVFENPHSAPDGRTVTARELLHRIAQRFETDRAMHPARRGKLHSSLGKAYFALGLYGESGAQWEKARNCLIQTVGLHHRSTLNAMRDLGLAYFEAGHEARALTLWEEVLALYRKSSGPDDPDALRTACYLARAWQNAGRADDALKIREDVLTLRNKSNGPLHPDTLDAMHELARSYFYTAAFRDKAVKMTRKVLALRREIFGAQHPDTLGTMSDLADYLADCDVRDQAMELREQLLPLRLSVLGSNHQLTLTSSAKLADSYMAAGRRDDAIALLENWIIRTPEFSLGFLKLCAIYAWLGKSANHAATARRSIEMFRESPHPVSAAHAAMGFLLVPSPDSQLLEPALALARRALKQGPETGCVAQRHRLALGMAEFRNGDDASAELTLAAMERRYVEVPLKSSRATQSTADFYRAMSCFRQGKAVAASQIFSKAEAHMKPVPVAGQPDAQNASHHDLICWLAWKEARQLIHPDSSQPDQSVRVASPELHL